MLTNSLYTKWAVRFFVLIYLMLITSTGNAFFWCMDAETSPHLESNLSGKCWTPCSFEPEESQGNEQTSNAGAAFSSGMHGCVDSPALSSVITPTKQNNPKSKHSITDVNKLNSTFFLAKCLLADSLEKPFLAHQLPFRQTMAALRTVVLLH